MKNTLFITLLAGMVVLIISLLTKNILLLGLAELIVIPSMVWLFKINLAKHN